MRLFVIIALAIFWIVLAAYEFKNGNAMLGGVFILVGIALTSYRLMRLRG
jgi:hypothetical protein